MLSKCCLNVGYILKNTPKMRILADFPMIFEWGFGHQMVALSVPNLSQHILGSAWICFERPTTLLAPATASARRFEKVEKWRKIGFSAKNWKLSEKWKNSHFDHWCKTERDWGSSMAMRMVKHLKHVYFSCFFWKCNFGQHLGNTCCLNVASMLKNTPPKSGFWPIFRWFLNEVWGTRWWSYRSQTFWNTLLGVRGYVLHVQRRY